MSFDLRRFMTFGWINVGMLSPALLAVSIGCVAWAASSLQDAVQSVQDKKALNSSGNLVTLKRDTASPDEIVAAANRLATMAPNVQVQVQSPNLVISISDPELFPEWLSALSAAQSTMKSYQWDLISLCMSSCKGAAAMAEITPTRPRFEVKKDQQ